MFPSCRISSELATFIAVDNNLSSALLPITTGEDSENIVGNINDGINDDSGCLQIETTPAEGYQAFR